MRFRRRTEPQAASSFPSFRRYRLLLNSLTSFSLLSQTTTSNHFSEEFSLVAQEQEVLRSPFYSKKTINSSSTNNCNHGQGNPSLQETCRRVHGNDPLRVGRLRNCRLFSGTSTTTNVTHANYLHDNSFDSCRIIKGSTSILYPSRNSASHCAFSTSPRIFLFALSNNNQSNPTRLIQQSIDVIRDKTGTQASFLIATSLAFGIGISVLAYVIAPISGGHINPAVTTSLLLIGQIGAVDAAAYVVTQMLASILGAGLVWGSMNHDIVRDSQDGEPPFLVGLNSVDSGISNGSAFCWNFWVPSCWSLPSA